MPERFQVRELDGWLTPRTGKTYEPRGLSVTVHDNAHGGQAVRVFRSEEYRRSHRRHAEQLALARADAAAECGRLNTKHGPFPSEDAA